MIDAIFKEDIDVPNKEKILHFVHKKRPADTQLIVSIAYKKEENDLMIHNYNKNHFDNNANLICIGDGVHEKAFLQSYTNQYNDLVEEIFEIIKK